MPAPLVSIIIPYYNHGRHLHQVVTSALNAYSGPLEVIVVDDGAIEAKAQAYLSAVEALSPLVKVVRKQNGGLSSARNAGIAASNGLFIQLLDSDDLLHPAKIDIQIQHLSIAPSLSVSITNYMICDEDGTQFDRDGDPIGRFDFALDDFLFHWERGFSIPIHCALFRRNLFDTLKFDTSVVGKEDWIFWCAVANAGYRAGYIPIFGAAYRQHASGMTRSYETMGKSWLTAADIILRSLGRDNQRFLAASRDWYDKFYRPRIEDAYSQVSAIPNGISSRTNAPQVAAVMRAVQTVRPVTVRPLISVVVPVFNHLEHLPECIESICNQQTESAYEVVIVDDHSTDPRVPQLLTEISRQAPHLAILRNDTNLGIAATQNRAAQLARGDYLAFVDCDDALPPNSLSEVEKALNRAPSIDYLYTDRADIDENGRQIRIARYGGYDWISPSHDVREDLLDGMIASHLKVIRRRVYLDVGGCSEDYSGVQDWELALRIARRGKFLYVPEPLYRHRVHSNSVTSSDRIRQFWLTNLVRRNYAAEYFGRSNAMMPRQARRENQPLVVSEFTNIQRLRDFKQMWRDGKTLSYIVRETPSLSEINLLREFNSYFDAIFVPDEPTAWRLTGYLWNRNILSSQIANSGAVAFRSLAFTG
jgi:glycosyltransferase involved in cell wall biosynthesis